VQRIAEHLGVSHQRVCQLLKDANLPPLPLRCRECEAIILTRPHGTAVCLSAWCLACLRRHPEATLGERVRTFRLAADLTQRQLAKQLGINHTTIAKLETCMTQPGRRLTEALIRHFGQALAKGQPAGGPPLCTQSPNPS
jgi:DNA-binding XRE family transcriptional regulator